MAEKRQEQFIPEEATGLRLVPVEYETDTYKFYAELDEIHIYAKAQRIVVNYDVWETYKENGKTYKGKGTYTLKDYQGTREFEVDEQGNEIDGTSVVIKEPQLFLTGWDSQLGAAISVPTINRIKAENGIV